MSLCRPTWRSIAHPAAVRAASLGLLVALTACDDSDQAAGASGFGGGGSTSDGGSMEEPGSTTTGVTTAGVSAGHDTSDASTTTTTDSGLDTGTDTGGECLLGSLDCACNVDWCEAGLTCSDGTCVNLSSCNHDPYEVNETEATASPLGELEDANSASVAGVLDGPDDVDWFVYDGDDDILNTVNPAREISATKGLRFCKFVECHDGLDKTVVECPGSATPATSPEGRPGCCSDTGFALENMNCLDTSEDNARIFFRVDQSVSGCVDYSIMYQY